MRMFWATHACTLRTTRAACHHTPRHGNHIATHTVRNAHGFEVVWPYWEGWGCRALLGECTMGGWGEGRRERVEVMGGQRGDSKGRGAKQRAIAYGGITSVLLEGGPGGARK